MKNRRFWRPLTVVILFSLSCTLFSGLMPGSGASTPLKASGKGPAGLTAQATSADSVKLAWQPVSGATSYRISASDALEGAYSVMALGPDATVYEDFMALPGTQLTYAVEALSDSGSIGQSVVQVTTPARKPNPLTVAAQLDPKKTASATIGPEGGSISLKDSKGVSYKLDIPAGALTDQTDISLTAVKSVAGWPLDGPMLAAVKLEPDGLQLDSLATLSITFPAALPQNDLPTVGFGFSGSGQEFHLQPLSDRKAGTGFVPDASGGGHLSSPARQDAATIVEETLFMYGVGVGAGSPASVGSLVRSSAPTSAGDALLQKAAAVGAALKSLILGPTDPNQLMLEEYLRNVKKTISDAEDCRDVHRAIGSASSWLDAANGRGLDPGTLQNGHDSLMQRLANKIKTVIDGEIENCQKQPGHPSKNTNCVQGLIKSLRSGSSQMFRDVGYKMGLGYSLQDKQAELNKCKPKSFMVTGNDQGITFSGKICNLEKPFEVNGTGNAGSWTAQFAPKSGLGGDMSETGSGACTEAGAGTYTVTLGADGSGTINFKEEATLSCPGLGTKRSSASLTFKIEPAPDLACP
jgi:hypothetical protein